MAANLIERSNHQPIGAGSASIQIHRQPSKNRGLNVGDVALPSSFEGRGELKKRTNFIQPPGRPCMGAEDFGVGRLPPAFAGKTLVERIEIDDRSSVSAAADLFHFVVGRYPEFKMLSLGLDDLGLGANLMTHGRGGKVPNVYRSADRALARIQIRPDGVEGGVFHHQHHDRGRQHLGQHGVLEPVGEMFREHTQRERSFCSQRYVAHLEILYCSRRSRDDLVAKYA
jgi:hypothetical protein